MENTQEIEELTERIKALVDKDKAAPFPYVGCNQLDAVLNKEGLDELDKGFYPDLCL